MRRPYLRRVLAWLVDWLFLSVLMFLCVLWFENELTSDQNFLEEMKRFSDKSQPSPISSMMQSLKEIPALQLERLGSSLGKTLTEIRTHFEKEQGVQIQLKDLLQLPDWLWSGVTEALEIAGFELDNDLQAILLRRYAQARLHKVRQSLKNLEKKNFSEEILKPLKRFVLFLVSLPAFYFVLEVLVGKSLGKMLTGLVIVRQTKFHESEKAQFSNLFIRWLLKCSEWLIFGIGIQLEMFDILAFSHLTSLAVNLGLLLVVGKSFQTLYDRLSGTGLVDKKMLKSAKGS